METFHQILKALFPMGMGLGLRLVGLLGDREGEVLRKFVVRFTLPVFVFYSLYRARPRSIAAIGPTVLAFVLMTVALFGLGWIASAAVRSAARKTAVHACITFGNYGWMGLGIMAALLGEAGVQRVVYFILPWWLAFYGLGLPIGLIHTRRRRGGVPLRKTVAVAAPPILAMVAGLAVNLGGLRIPGSIGFVLKPFGDATVPLILLSVGVMLDVSRVGPALKPALLISAVTLLAGPLVGWALAAGLAGDTVTYKVIIIEGAMPVATLTPILEENYEMDKELVSTAIVMSTVLSLVTIPILVGVVVG